MDLEGIYEVKKEIEAIGEERLVELENIYGRISSAIVEFDGTPNKYVYRVELIKQLNKIARKIQNSSKLSAEDVEKFDLTLSLLKKWRFVSAKDALKTIEPTAGLRERKKSLLDNYRREYNIQKERKNTIKKEIERLNAIFKYPILDEEEILLKREELKGYNSNVSDILREFVQNTSSREVIMISLDAQYFPELIFPHPYDPKGAGELHNYLKSEKIGGEPIYKILEYNRYSRDRLSHYLDNPSLFKDVTESNIAWLESLNELWKKNTAKITFGERKELLYIRIRRMISFISSIAKYTNISPNMAVEYLISQRKLIISGEYDIFLESDRLKEIYTMDEIQRMKGGGLSQEIESLKRELKGIEEELDLIPEPKELL
ncbi:MAG: hypothetical protein SVJ22_04300 [Halobacteriota archaeon]|nr:hypothetical protein [Halobacteriota archaeon]